MDQKQTHSLPSVSELFTTSWHTLTQSLLSLFLLNILGIAIYIGLAVLAGLIIVFSGVGSFFLKNGLQNFPTSLLNIPSSTYIIVGIVALIFFLISIIISSALQIASVLLVDSEGKLPLMAAFKKSFKFIIPLMLVGILTFILSFGALFVLILPVILFALLLMFVQFEVILNNQRWLEAIKRSVLVVSKNFGGIFVRLLMLWLIYFGIFTLNSILQSILPQSSKWIPSLISFIFNLLAGWFSLAYTINLYKQAAAAVTEVKNQSILWMWVIALIGWLIAIALGFASYKAISSGILNNLFNQIPTTQQQLPRSNFQYKTNFEYDLNSL